ncbi:hypothetical protein OMAG_002137 [Candidatus Omnitrophus magneticus]|uniref:Uncharacterized protein n=1 Tax=Candidatus Omnitrophus magneticus TaxID=1609969 RepID=A0A0F0CR50_9BACT|nr:hypothetical protein OMAG_002137 [Candidatus Omnitrophus magneticus]
MLSTAYFLKNLLVCWRCRQNFLLEIFRCDSWLGREKNLNFFQGLYHLIYAKQNS